MDTMTRKQRETAQREELVLDVGRRILVERGYLGLTMDRVAEATEYSKGTIYQHFPNKEELVVALAIQTAHKRAEFFERAATFPGRTRERMAAIGEAADLFQRVFPEHMLAEDIACTSSIREKTSPERQKDLQACDLRCMGITTGIVRDALSQGDLTLREGVRPEDVVFGLWAMHMGTAGFVTSGRDMTAVGIPDPMEALWTSYNAYLDGFAWQPLSHEMDYGATLERVRAEIFPDEARLAQG